MGPCRWTKGPENSGKKVRTTAAQQVTALSLMFTVGLFVLRLKHRLVKTAFSTVINKTATVWTAEGRESGERQRREKKRRKIRVMCRYKD